MAEGLIFWFSGLSGAGKSTIALGAREQLEARNRRVAVIDGDDVRKTMSRHLGFTKDDILENNARVAALCKETRRKVDVVLVPIISPFDAGRQAARAILGDGFFEIYVKATVDCVRRRDVKDLYAKAARGEISNLIGVSPNAPYETPVAPDLVIDTEQEDAALSIRRFIEFVEERFELQRVPT